MDLIEQICKGWKSDEIREPVLEDVIVDGKFYCQSINDDVCFTLKDPLNFNILLDMLSRFDKQYKIRFIREMDSKDTLPVTGTKVRLQVSKPTLRIEGKDAVINLFDYLSNNPSFQIFPGESGKYEGAKVADQYIATLRVVKK